MYTDFYGLREKPFELTPDPQFFYPAPGHKRALAYLEFGLKEKKGIIVISGEVGAGKTTLSNVLLDNLNKRDKVARILNPVLEPLDMLKAVLQGFGLPYDSDSKRELLDRLYRFLLQQYSLNCCPILIIDEAQNMDFKLLEEIRMLSNLETPKEKLIQIILVGQPELRQKLALPELYQLRQRIAVIYHLNPLSHEEVRLYIQHRLAVAGRPQADIFSVEAMEAIFRTSGGIPRIINLLCDASLLAGYAEDRHTIGTELIEEVQQSLGMFSTLPTKTYPNSEEIEYQDRQLEPVGEPKDLIGAETIPDNSRKTARSFNSFKLMLLTMISLSLILIPMKTLEWLIEKGKILFQLEQPVLTQENQSIPGIEPPIQKTYAPNGLDEPKEELSIEPESPVIISKEEEMTAQAPSSETISTEPAPTMPSTPALPSESQVINSEVETQTDSETDYPRDIDKDNLASVTTYALTVRRGKGHQYEAISWIREGVIVQILDDSDDWYQVKIPSGKIGYVLSKYLTPIE